MAKTPSKVSELIPDRKNFNRGTERGSGLLERSLRNHGAGRSILLDKKNRIIAGNKTVEQAGSIGIEDVIVVDSDGKKLIAVRRTDLDLEKDKSAQQLAVLDNRIGELSLDWNPEELLASKDELDLLQLGFTDAELTALEDRATIEKDDYADAPMKLTDKFLVPPFSILDSTQGYWLQRKRQWWALGMQGTLGREGNAYERTGKDFFGAKMRSQQKHKSTTDFDPVMAEIAYRWFAPLGGTVLDPFSGGCVRGVVAAKLGYKYIGIDVRPDQIAENERQARQLLKKDGRPQYRAGDSRNVLLTLPEQSVDFVFSSPPYAGIEVHSELPDDISNMDDKSFRRAYEDIIVKAVARLRENRFACFVVGDARDKKGYYKNFPAFTVDCFQKAGAILYNEAVLKTAVMSLAYRISSHFPNYRKLGKCHQNVLVFYKGDIKRIPEELGLVELPPVEEMDGVEDEQLRSDMDDDMSPLPEKQSQTPDAKKSVDSIKVTKKKK